MLKSLAATALVAIQAGALDTHSLIKNNNSNSNSTRGSYCLFGALFRTMQSKKAG